MMERQNAKSDRQRFDGAGIATGKYVYAVLSEKPKRCESVCGVSLH